jgi:hypothetical protein
MTSKLLVIAIVCSPLLLSAQDVPKKLPPGKAGGTVNVGSKPSWSLSDEERIAARMASSGGPRAARPDSANSGRFEEAIDGRSHPEQFMPYEIFDYLLYTVGPLPKAKEALRRHLEPKLASYGYNPSTFWSQLETISAHYLASSSRSIGHAPAAVLTLASGATVRMPVAKDVCTARFQALQMARQTLGPDFDRFLYTAVAPEINHSSGGQLPYRAEQLSYMARGCP